MAKQDTIKLLRECDAGVKMGIASIGDVLGRTHADALKHRLEDCKTEHEKLEREIRSRLHEHHDGGKKPNPMAKTMSQLKTNFKLTVNNSDATVADLMTDGCNMGVKSLHKYLNQYQAAEEPAKNITRRLIDLEETLAIDIRRFL